MRKIFTIFLLSISTVNFGQKSIQFADSIRKSFNIPQISYAVIDSKSIFEVVAIGNHSTKLPDIATLKDRFHIGSNTKAMTAFVIAKYVEGGKLDWNTKFFDLFPEWKEASKSDYFNITLQDLLAHRAGIQPFQGFDDSPIPEFTGTRKIKREKFGQFVLTLDAVEIDTLNPFIYSNAGYTLAALMVEQVTKKSWEELVQKVYNKDLNLKVKFSWPENQKHPGTWGHSFENGKLTPIPSNVDFHLDYTEPAGDLNIKLPDYIKFIQLNLDGLSGNENYLKVKTYNYIHRGVEKYSMGWFNVFENNRELSVHSGTAGTYYSLVHIDRTNDKAYIIFTNSFSPETQQGVRLLMRKLKENYGS